MGKKKGFRSSYPESSPANITSTSFRIHRTASNRLGGRTYVHRIQEAPTEAATTETHTDNEPNETPWSDSFFAGVNDDNRSAVVADHDTTVPAFDQVTSRPARFLEDYVEHRQSILDQIIELDGRLGSRLCHDCAIDEGLYRCQDCIYPGLYCATCISGSHTKTPFHRILVR